MTVALAELDLRDVVAVRGDPRPSFPVEPNTTAVVDGRLVLWLGPNEWLVLGGRETDFPEAAAAVNLSANRVALELAGAGAADVLARGCSLDLHPAAFAPGRCAQTLVAKAQVILHRAAADRFVLLVRPSYAPYLRAWFADAAAAAEAAP